jgi:hypothetical protein
VRAVLAAALTALLMTVTACSSSGPTDDERAVCGTVQEMVGLLVVGGRGPDALAALDLLAGQVEATENETLAREGGRLFDAITVPVDDHGAMSMSQVAVEGQLALEGGSAGLDGLIQECDRLGLAVEGLPSTPVPYPGVTWSAPLPSDSPQPGQG